MLKFGGGFILGFIAGFAALFVLTIAFGDYEDEPVTTQVQTISVAPAITPTPLPTDTVADMPTATATPQPTFTPVPTPTPTPLPTNTPIPVLMNQDLTLDGIRWRAIEVQEIGTLLEGDNEWTEDVTTTGKFVRVLINVENKRNEPDTGYEAPALVDGQGRRFRAYDERFFYIPEEQSCYIENFNPNLPRDCMEIYEVAGDSTGLYKLVVNNFESYDPLEAIIDLR